MRRLLIVSGAPAALAIATAGLLFSGGSAAAAQSTLPPVPPPSSQSITAQSPSTLPELAPAPPPSPQAPPPLPPRPLDLPAPLISSQPLPSATVPTSSGAASSGPSASGSYLQPQPRADPSISALPAPDRDPLRVDTSRDPILRLGRAQSPREPFRLAVAAAVTNHPRTLESLALTDEAREVLGEARERRLPSADLTISSYRVISREFSDDPENIIERSRADRRTDALAAVNYTLFDWGAGTLRVTAAGARLRAAAAETEDGADRVALAAVAAWYDVFAFRALVAVSGAFIEDQADLRRDVATRIREGVSAEGDLAQVDSFVAAANTRLAEFRRTLANAEARYAELIGAPPPATLGRAPVPTASIGSRDEAAAAALTTPAVRAAEAVADASDDEAKAARRDNLPQVGVGIDAGRYGVIETDNDYDIRARVTVRQRLFGGADARARQVAARARAADARASRVRDEAGRDAAIAWGDVVALQQQLTALEANYVASRTSRDVLVERFANSRGTLFDVASSQNAYFATAAAYIRTLSELDAARYVLLSRTGALLPSLGIDAAQFGGDRTR